MNKFRFLLFACVILYQDGGSCKKHGRRPKSIDEKIVGGYSITIENAPYQAYLLLEKGLINKEYYQCGGSIISKRHILTAAHCIDQISQVFARVGSTDSDSGGQMYSTRIMTKHPSYNPRTYDYDVAVLTFLRDMTIDGIRTKVVSLPNENDGPVPANVLLFVTGWGATTEGGDTSSTLMAVNVPTISEAECKRNVTNLTQRMICAGYPEGGKDSCQGDSGGPAVNNNVQLGIVSFGMGCARPSYPGVYTNVTAVRTWIRTTTGV